MRQVFLKKDECYKLLIYEQGIGAGSRVKYMGPAKSTRLAGTVFHIFHKLNYLGDSMGLTLRLTRRQINQKLVVFDHALSRAVVPVKEDKIG